LDVSSEETLVSFSLAVVSLLSIAITGGQSALSSSPGGVSALSVGARSARALLLESAIEIIFFLWAGLATLWEISLFVAVARWALSAKRKVSLLSVVGAEVLLLSLAGWAVAVSAVLILSAHDCCC